jgi:predicted transporter
MRIPRSLIATQERLDWFFRPKNFFVFVLVIAVGMYIGFTGLAQYGDLLIAWGYVFGPILIILALLFVPLESKHDGEKLNFSAQHIARFFSAEQRLPARPPLV